MMKKQGKASTAMVMWVMIVLVHAHLSISIAAAHEINGTTHSVCSGSVQDCLNIANDDFDSEFPDAISSHFHRRVLQHKKQPVIYRTLDRHPVIQGFKKPYRGSSVLNAQKVGLRDDCRDQYNRGCPQ